MTAVDLISDALAQEGPFDALVRRTEEGEQYVDLATDVTSQPVESVWFDAGKVVWGEDYQFSLAYDEGDDAAAVARAILYTLRDSM